MKKREFLLTVLSSLVLMPIAVYILGCNKQESEGNDSGSSLPKLRTDDPAAQVQGYVHDASKADVAKFPKRQGPEGAKQFCNTCNFYTATSDPKWGLCSIFPKN